MTHYSIGFLILTSCCLLEALPRPTNNESKHGGGGGGIRRRVEEYQYDGMRFSEGPFKMGRADFMIFVEPTAYAQSEKGVAIANPISNVVIARNKTGSIVHAPAAVAVVGPGGVAHAQSDLYLYEYVQEATVQYLPFYGGAKGQYLEIKKDNSGSVTSETIISEDKIGSENIIKNSDENLLSKVLAANLQTLRTLSNNILKLHNLGRKTGRLGYSEKTRFKSQLAALGDAASNTIKLVEEVGDSIDNLFVKNATQRKRYEDAEVDDEENDDGVGIDAGGGSSSGFDYDIDGGTIAEAKPIGLAVIGENGVAAARPIGTAVAASGVAIARPVGTAIAGFNPPDLGINLQINHSRN